MRGSRVKVFFLVGNGISVGAEPAEDLEEILANVEVLRDYLHAVRSLSGALASRDLRKVAQAVSPCRRGTTTRPETIAQLTPCRAPQYSPESSVTRCRDASPPNKAPMMPP
jgi:hypothetical protein